MALCEAFRRSNQIQQFVLSGVKTKNKELGRGSYGSVEEVLYQHRTYAGKKLYADLIDVGNEGADTMAQKFLHECQLMSSLRHPNITLFIGICFFPNENLPLLVMEKLEQNLDDLLENTPNLPLSLKCSILEDVASGLFYLHKMEPPIVHRDLTARNVLLTASFVAKISDLGNARIIGTGGRQKLTTVPGTPVYMPPEAEGDYGPSLDIFSFGHLSLYTITQVFPKDLLLITYTDPKKPRRLKARTELERRKKYTELMESQIELSCPKLVLCVKQCLHNDPNKRPSSENLLINIQEIASEVETKERIPVRSGNIFERLMAKMSQELMEENQTHKELTAQQAKKIDELKTACKELEDEKETLKQEYESRISAKVVMLQQQENEIKSQTAVIHDLVMENKALKTVKPVIRSNENNDASQKITAKANDTPKLAEEQKKHNDDKQQDVIESQLMYQGCKDETKKLATTRSNTCLPAISAELKQHLERRKLSETARLEDHSKQIPNEDEKIDEPVEEDMIKSRPDKGIEEVDNRPQPQPRSRSKPVASHPQPKPRPTSAIIHPINSSEDHTSDQGGKLLETESNLKPTPPTRTSSLSSRSKVTTTKQQLLPQLPSSASHDYTPRTQKCSTLPTTDSTDKSKMAPWQMEWRKKKQAKTIVTD